jgi:DNA replication protein DnaC
MSAQAPPLADDLVAGLRRLKLATIRTQAPEILQSARTQRWSIEEVLRTLVAAEIDARDKTNQQLRLKAANLPVLKELETFDAAASSVPMATFDYITSLEWIRARENLLLVGRRNRQEPRPGGHRIARRSARAAGALCHGR